MSFLSKLLSKIYHPSTEGQHVDGSSPYSRQERQEMGFFEPMPHEVTMEIFKMTILGKRDSQSIHKPYRDETTLSPVKFPHQRHTCATRQVHNALSELQKMAKCMHRYGHLRQVCKEWKQLLAPYDEISHCFSLTASVAAFNLKQIQGNYRLAAPIEHFKSISEHIQKIKPNRDNEELIALIWQCFVNATIAVTGSLRIDLIHPRSEAPSDLWLQSGIREKIKEYQKNVHSLFENLPSEAKHSVKMLRLDQLNYLLDDARESQSSMQFTSRIYTNHSYVLFLNKLFPLLSHFPDVQRLTLKIPKGENCLREPNEHYVKNYTIVPSAWEKISASCPHLKELVLIHTFLPPFEAIPFPHLSHLTIAHSHCESSALFNELLPFAAQMQSIRLYDCDDILDKEFTPFLQQATSLIGVDFGKCKEPDENTISTILQLPKLKYFRLGSQSHGVSQ